MVGMLLQECQDAVGVKAGLALLKHHLDALHHPAPVCFRLLTCNSLGSHNRFLLVPNQALQPDCRHACVACTGPESRPAEL